MTEQLDLTDEEKRALIALLKRTLEYARLPAGTAPRPAESDPGQARSTAASARTSAAAASRHGADTRARKAAAVMYGQGVVWGLKLIAPLIRAYHAWQSLQAKWRRKLIFVQKAHSGWVANEGYGPPSRPVHGDPSRPRRRGAGGAGSGPPWCVRLLARSRGL
jgi:hypothetical protein